MFAIRFLYIHLTHPIFDLSVRKSIPLRFDALFIGVLFSIVKINHTTIYQKLIGVRALIFSILIFAVTFFIYKKYVLLADYAQDNFIKSFFQGVVFIFFSFSFGFFIIFLENCSLNRVSKSNFFLRIVTALSILTYAIYLVHYDIFKHIIVSANFTAGWLREVGLSLLILFAVAFVLHAALEKPAMDYRRKLIGIVFRKKEIKTVK
jgi:peptidoglycan/LPS O-acetylase OafA/YrhL